MIKGWRKKGKEMVGWKGKERKRETLPSKKLILMVLRQNVASHKVYVTKRNCY
jgi:hypothetical protein